MLVPTPLWDGLAHKKREPCGLPSYPDRSDNTPVRDGDAYFKSTIFTLSLFFEDSTLAKYTPEGTSPAFQVTL